MVTHMRTQESTEIAIIGAGIAGIAAAYYLSRLGVRNITLLESGQPMAFTSAQSGDNFRNWWPHPVMTQFTDHSIDLLQQIAELSDNRINMHCRGYLLATRADDIDELTQELYSGYAGVSEASIRIHEKLSPAYTGSLDSAADGVDVLSGGAVKQAWPALDAGVRHIVHIRKAGDIDGQQLGQFMLEKMSTTGVRLLRQEVVGIERGSDFVLHLSDGSHLAAEQIIFAAGPFVNDLLKHLGESLPVTNVFQQKLAFEDVHGAIPRNQPFCVDLDAQALDWSDDEREMIASDEQLQWLAAELPGGTHCRPEGGEHGRWVKLGWAYNTTATQASREPVLDDLFPEIVLRGAARLNPGLKQYYERLPVRRSHYGGYYTMTEENWPLIGALNTPGAWVISALSGFGSMAACAAGELCAQALIGTTLPEYATQLSLDRYQDDALMEQLRAMARTGSL